ncbi:MAG: hypothetical protein OEZ21_05085 [Candidatus Bathyarchaeota archaeon]|nr:hypothetical protein [Candidatus Bathyarchaeota archaeon]
MQLAWINFSNVVYNLAFGANLIVSKFDYKKAYETVMNFFGSNKVKFAAVDGAEFKRALSLKNRQRRRNLRSLGNSL